ncbi:MAG: AAA family ATPase [Hymenobacter sp.]|nr:AAA family ATPase [Hymenobacter sp.]
MAEARDRVERMLIEVLPGVTKLQIANAGTPQKPQISLQFLLFDTWVRLRDMSLGYQTLVVWLTDLASKLYVRYPDSANPLAESAIVLIDEIDLHLHPSWQRELLKKLSGIFPNTQFIATAHSPLVVQAAGDAGANVVLLKRDGDQTVVHQHLEDVRGWRLDQILTSELFGLETARSPETERKLERRADLLTKAKRTAAEKKELEQLTHELAAEPLGETPSEREVNAVLQELRQRLLKPDSSASAA